MLNKKMVLFSLYDQKDAITYAKQLIDLGWEIIATKETYDLFKRNNIAVQDISNFLKIKNKYPFPPTLHPSIELSLTAEQGNTIDFVYITTYPLPKGNDVGGHTILALAAKGNRIVVFNREDMKKTIKDLQENNNEISPLLRQWLINRTYTKIIRHYSALIKNSESSLNTDVIIGKNVMTLLEGENPYQTPSHLFKLDNNDTLMLSNFRQVGGALPCYTNMADFDSILHTLCLITEAFAKLYRKIPYIVVAAKHGNPCGLAVDWNSPKIAVRKALFGHPLAIFGGELITNFLIDKRLARVLISSNRREQLLGSSNWSLDLITAVDFDDEAIKVLNERKKLKLFMNESLIRPQLNKMKWSYRMVRGGFLRQPPNNYILDFSKNDSGFSLSNSNYLDSLIIAWVSAWTSMHGGNEIAIAKNRMLLSAGGGPATIDSCYAAINKAKKCGHDLKGSVFAANAFFPFTDAPQQLSKAGCIYGIVPKGGRNFELIKGYFQKHKVKVFYLPEQFRGFCRH